MADNVTLNVGSGGAVVGADDIGGIQFQRVKLIHGPDGTNQGDISHDNPLPTIPWHDSMVRQGKTFMVQHYKAAATAIDFSFKVPAGSVRSYLSIFIGTSTDAVVVLTEAPTWTVNTGSRLALLNLDRDSANTSQEQDDTAGGAFSDNDSIALDQTGFAGGTVLDTIRIAAIKDTIANVHEGGTHFMLANDTQYRIGLTATSGAITLGIILTESDGV